MYDMIHLIEVGIINNSLEMYSEFGTLSIFILFVMTRHSILWNLCCLRLYWTFNV